MPTSRSSHTVHWRRWCMHLFRVGMLAAIVVLIHRQQAAFDAERQSLALVALDADIVLASLQEIFPTAAQLGDNPLDEGMPVEDAAGTVVGRVIQTAPQSNGVIGFSGPTNLLIGFDLENKIAGVAILESDDTRDHVALIRRSALLEQWQGDESSEAAAREVDAVSGATLTSLAIWDSIRIRLGGKADSSRFPTGLELDRLKRVFRAEAVRQADQLRENQDTGLWELWSGGTLQGQILRTSPAADHVLGYQGPTDVWLLLDPSCERLLEYRLGESFDNEPYVSYVRDDAYFHELLEGVTVADLASTDVGTEVEGVSGATMTSVAVAESIAAAAQKRQQEQARRSSQPPPWWLDRANMAACALVASGALISLTKLRGIRWLALVWRLILVGALGIWHGDMISQAMLYGWAQHGAPWARAPSLVLLTMAAILLPITSGRNVYCSHLCAHGAAQQLVKNRLPWKWRPSRRVAAWLRQAPLAIWVACLLIVLFRLPASLVDFEPFDAWVWRAAGAGTIAIAVVGLTWSLVTPMAYCRYGCPTGWLLNHTRIHRRSGRWTWQDGVVLGLVTIAALL